MGRLRVALFACFTLNVLLLPGCGSSNLVEVKGTVRFDGQLVENGSIRFESEDAKTTKGGIIKDGAYSASVPVGKMKVSFTAVKVVGKTTLYDNPEGPFRDITIDFLREKYGQEKSELRYQVTPGRNEKDWDLSP